jgi:hypothetical protein
MIRIKDHKQQHLFDPWGFLSPKRRQILEQGWPGLFREHFLEELPVEQMASFFSSGSGRPTKELHTVLGVLLLQQTLDLSDQATIEQLCFNTQWHYALNIPEESDEAKYISEKTLYSSRQKLIEKGLDQIVLEQTGQKLAAVFGVDPEKQRLDSVQIRSNMRKLGRIRIFSQTILKFLVNLKRHHRDLFDGIDPEVTARYWGKKAQSAFSLVKPSESGKTLKTVSADLFGLIERFKDQPAVCAMHSYKLMQRVLSDQCEIKTDDTGEPKVEVKKPAEIPSNSLQNPSDPDATYSGHKGQGYQVQIMETFSCSEDPAEREQTLNLITHVAVQPACESDAHALIPAIADTQVRGLGPDELLADTLYGSDENHRVAAAAGVELVAPTSRGGEKKPLSEFQFDAVGNVTACPAGHAPTCCEPKKNAKYGAVFELERCQDCPRLSECPVKLGKNGAYLNYSAKQARLAQRRAREQTETFLDTYRWRAGVEATMSELDRLTGIKKLRVRGFGAVRFCAIMKAAGLNLLRAARVRRARAKALAAQNGCFGVILSAYRVFKERVQAGVANFGLIYPNQPPAASADLKLAA